MLSALRTAPAIGLLTAAVALTGCGALADDSEGITVAAGFYPLAYVAEQVAGDHAEVVNLTKPGQEPHDSELTIAKTAAIARADLVIVSGGFQPPVEAGVEQNATGAVLDVAEVLDLEPAAGADGDEHGSQEGHEGHDHGDLGDLDPHFWHDPLLMADLGDEVADELADLDPEHAEDYQQNAAALRERLTELDQEFTDGLARCERDTVVVSHDAFGYLRRYGLEFEPIAGLSPGAEPTPADLQRLQRLVRDNGITTVFSERLASSAMADSLADDLQVRTDVLDPIEGLTEDTADEDYVSLMEANLRVLRKANGC
ncbi:metal ABC transporter substrate-binding protein [Nocardioides sp. 616]|uniref:metal ABC transporter substrate-binding protein n=1 Tax=Nocardioides sp. 616 TaxID=2268090 RepID=UPI000CE42A7C|nr:metal ABC transporter substrate-binding protein [Nocardioides sp. 616]